MTYRSTVARVIHFSLLLLAGLSVPLGAQQFSGTLRGTVKDATGAVVPGAEVSR